MNPRTLRYIMGHSDTRVTLNSCTHPGPEVAVFAKLFEVV